MRFKNLLPGSKITLKNASNIFSLTWEENMSHTPLTNFVKQRESDNKIPHHTHLHKTAVQND